MKERGKEGNVEGEEGIIKRKRRKKERGWERKVVAKD